MHALYYPSSDQVNRIYPVSCLTPTTGLHSLLGMKPDNDLGTTGGRLADAREAMGWSQPQLSQITGVSQQMISKLERGVTTESKFLYALASTLKVSAEWLINGKGPRKLESNLSEDTLECALIIEMLAPEDRVKLSPMLKLMLKGAAATNNKVEKRMPVTKEPSKVVSASVPERIKTAKRIASPDSAKPKKATR